MDKLSLACRARVASLQKDKLPPLRSRGPLPKPPKAQKKACLGLRLEYNDPMFAEKQFVSGFWVCSNSYC